MAGFENQGGSLMALLGRTNLLFGDILGGILGGLGGGIGGGAGGGVAAAPTNIGFGVFGRGAAFASGGALTNRILRRPTLFPLADGLGLAGEAGPEAILPLTRMGSGELGVKAAMMRLPEASPVAPANAQPPALAMAA